MAVHHASYAAKFHVEQYLRRGGVFILNTAASTAAELDQLLPARLRLRLSQLRAQVRLAG